MKGTVVSRPGFVSQFLPEAGGRKHAADGNDAASHAESKRFCGLKLQEEFLRWSQRSVA